MSCISSLSDGRSRIQDRQVRAQQGQVVDICLGGGGVRQLYAADFLRAVIERGQNRAALVDHAAATDEGQSDFACDTIQVDAGQPVVEGARPCRERIVSRVGLHV